MEVEDRKVPDATDVTAHFVESLKAMALPGAIAFAVAGHAMWVGKGEPETTQGQTAPTTIAEQNISQPFPEEAPAVEL